MYLHYFKVALKGSCLYLHTLRWRWACGMFELIVIEISTSCIILCAIYCCFRERLVNVFKQILKIKFTEITIHTVCDCLIVGRVYNTPTFPSFAY